MALAATPSSRSVLLGSFLALSLAACAGEGDKGTPGVGTLPGNVTGDGDSTQGDGDSTQGDGDNNGQPLNNGDGDGDDYAGGDGDDVGGDGDDTGSSNCDGIDIGGRCVNPDHLKVVEASPQPTDPGNLVYNFDKSFTNIGGLKKNEPKIAPSADLGQWYLYNGDYVRIGVAYRSFKATGGNVADKDRLPQREGLNKDLTWSLNAVKAHNGSDIAAPNCLVCHYEYFQGKLIPGLGRNKRWIATDASGFTLDVVGIGINSIFQLDTFSQINEAIGMLVRLFPDTMHSHLFDLFAALGMRHDPNTLRWTGKLWGDPNSGMKGWIEFPAWWNAVKKNALYANGSGRGYKGDHMLYMSWFSVEGVEEAEEIQNNFYHVQKWFEQGYKAPKFEDFGGKIDQNLADKGEEVFLEYCATCHGTYSEDESLETYPNFIVHYDEVGTDPRLATNHWIYPVKPWYEASWYGKRKTSWIEKTDGYFAPPLDGIFITAPYLHNGSVPTLEALIDPTKRPKVWTSNMSDDDYDFDKLGWKDKPFDLRFWSLDQGEGAYYTDVAGNSNAGHTYGAELSAEDKSALLEYLKTL